MFSTSNWLKVYRRKYSQNLKLKKKTHPYAFKIKLGLSTLDEEKRKDLGDTLGNSPQIMLLESGVQQKVNFELLVDISALPKQEWLGVEAGNLRTGLWMFCPSLCNLRPLSCRGVEWDGPWGILRLWHSESLWIARTQDRCELITTWEAHTCLSPVLPPLTSSSAKLQA